MFKTYNITNLTAYQDGVPCENPLIEAVDSTVEINCDGWTIQVPEDTFGCITFSVDCSNECDACGPQLIEVCFCGNNEDCGPCQECNESVCETYCEDDLQCINCGNGDICGDCCEDNDCECGNICIGNICTCPTGTFLQDNGCCYDCENDSHCELCETCEGGTCINSCIPYVCNEDSNGNEICEGLGDCVECTNNGNCPSNQVCNNCGCGCPTGYTLCDDICILEGECCGNEGQCTYEGCPNAGICGENGQCESPCENLDGYIFIGFPICNCLPICDTNISCDGSPCTNGQCIENPNGCDYCLECDEGQIFFNGQCYDECDCTPDGCLNGDYCSGPINVQGQCICIPNCLDLPCDQTNMCADHPDCFCNEDNECDQCPNCNGQLLKLDTPHFNLQLDSFSGNLVNGMNTQLNFTSTNIFEESDFEYCLRVYPISSTTYFQIPITDITSFSLDEVQLSINGEYEGEYFILDLLVKTSSGINIYSEKFEFTALSGSTYTLDYRSRNQCNDIFRYDIDSQCDINWNFILYNKDDNTTTQVEFETWENYAIGNGNDWGSQDVSTISCEDENRDEVTVEAVGVYESCEYETQLNTYRTCCGTLQCEEDWTCPEQPTLIYNPTGIQNYYDIQLDWFYENGDNFYVPECFGEYATGLVTDAGTSLQTDSQSCICSENCGWFIERANGDLDYIDSNLGSDEYSQLEGTVQTYVNEGEKVCFKTCFTVCCDNPCTHCFTPDGITSCNSELNICEEDFIDLFPNATYNINELNNIGQTIYQISENGCTITYTIIKIQIDAL